MANNYLKNNIKLGEFIVCLLWLSLCNCIPLKAQQAQAVRGMVADDYGHPLSGVTVFVKTHPTAVVLSDSTGHFAISAGQGDQLVFSQVGLDTYQTTVQNDNSLFIRMGKTFLSAPEKINTLYDVQPVNAILGSVSTVYNRQLITTPAAQYTFGLTGRLPGLYTQQLSGWSAQSSKPLINPDVFLWVERMAGTEGAQGPNDNSQMLLSLRGQTPVTIIDGVQRDFYSMSPENIESVSVLKDALSTILLGQQSSRGILLVTTKRPEAGETRISFTAQTARMKPLDLPKPLPAYQYAWLYNEGLLNDNRSPVYTAEDFQAYRDGSDPTGHPDINWYKAALNDDAPLSRYDLNITGGGHVAHYTMGLGYMNKQGLFKEDANTPYNTNAAINRYTVNSHIDVDVTQDFNVGLDIFGRIENTNQPGAGIPAIMAALISTPANAYPLHNLDGSLGGNQIYTNNIFGMVANTGYMAGHNRDVMANLDLKYDFHQWLPGLWAKVKGNISVSSSDVIDRSKGFPVFGMVQLPNGDTSYNRYGSPYDQRNVYSLTSFAEYWYGQLSVGYDTQVGKNNLSALLFTDQRQATINYDLPSKYTNLALKASYNYDQKYFAEAAVNYSGYDRFPPGSRFGLFYAAGIGWDMAQENFIKENISWIDQLKWRATYGKTGNANVGYFIYEQYYMDNGPFAAYFGGTWIPGEIENTPLPNPNPTWEKADKLNIGLDISLFKSHFRLTADYYNNKYYDLMQLRGKTIALLGNNYSPENIGINRYTGEELSLTYQDNCGALNWFITANASVMKTKVLYMDEVRRSYAWNKRTGQQVGQMFGYIAEGLFQSQKEIEAGAVPEGMSPVPGDIKYKDLNNDGIINDFDQAPIGNTKPLMYYGINAGISFKGLDLSVLVQGTRNRSIVLNGPGAWPFYAFANGQAWEENLGRWTPQTAAEATSPRLTAGFNQNNTSLPSTYWIRSGDYFRLKNVEIGYNLPFKWVHHLKLGSVRFFANGLNLFTHSENEGIDPEVSSQISGAVYPIQQVTNVGVTIKF